MKRIKSCKGLSGYTPLSIAQAARMIKRGGIVAYPTETFYGLGADPRNPKALRKLYRIKGRDAGKPISIILASFSELKNWVELPSLPLIQKIKRLWPGRVTIIFKAKEEVSPLLTAGSGTLGVRIPPHPAARRLAKNIGGAITATSANLSGSPSCSTMEEVEVQLGKKLDGIMKAPQLKLSKGSTIIDVSGGDIKLIREGDVPFPFPL